MGKLVNISLLTLLSIISFNLNVLAAPPNSAKKIRWVLAHEPVGLFKEAADYFSTQIAKKTKGTVAVEVLTLPEYSAKYNNGKPVKQSEVVQYIRSGKIEMSQTYTTDLGELNPDLYVLDMPYIFRDHGHAKKVLEGKIGDSLLAGLASANLRGLAFTYSGGYRIIPSNKAITKIEDFAGLRIRTSNSPVAKDTFTMLGATPVPLGLDQIAEAVQNNTIEGAESTYPRFYSMKQNEFSKVLNDTKHSLFLTAIVVNDGTWSKLSGTEQALVKETAIEAARIEREKSVKDAVITLQKCMKEGINIVNLSKSEEQRFKKAVEPLYKKYENVFSSNLLGSISALK